MKIRLLSLFLVLLMLSSALLTSCKPGGNTPADSSSDSGSETTPVVEDIVLFADNKTSFRIIRPDAADAGVCRVAVSLWEDLSNYTDDIDESFDLKNDMLKRDETIPETENVILVGYTNRPDSAVAFENLGYADYRIKVINGRIYIAGYTESALNIAISKFLKHVSENTVDGKCVITTDLLIEGSTDSLLGDLPAIPGKIVSATHDMGDKCQLIVTDECDEDTFINYKKLLAAKYSEYTTNEIGNNLFATYTSDKSVINTYYTPASKEIRTTIEPLSETALPGLESENKYTSVTTPLLTQIGVERVGNTADYQNGMCYIFRLSDGRFIVYDGGFTNSNTDATKINDALKEQAPNPNKIVIAAWIITHAHGDHNGAFRTFVKKYNCNLSSSAYTIENVIRNTPSDTDCESASLSLNTKNAQAEVENTLKSRGCNLIKSHPGQVFYYADAKITVIYNLEMYVPKAFTYFNTSTTVTNLELAGQSFSMLGDASEDASGLMVKHYDKESIGCDFVQVAHHGYQGGTTAVYKLIDPTYVLWPMATTAYAKYRDHARSEYLVSSSKKVEAIFTAGHAKYVFHLPFTGNNYEKTEYTK